LGSKKYGIGLYNVANGEILLLDKELNPISGFPQTGYSSFDLSESSESGNTKLIAVAGENSQVLIMSLD
jgi:hypothetical protein